MKLDALPQLEGINLTTISGILDRPTLGQCWKNLSFGTILNQSFVYPIVGEELVWIVSMWIEISNSLYQKSDVESRLVDTGSQIRKKNTSYAQKENNLPQTFPLVHLD